MPVISRFDFAGPSGSQASRFVLLVDGSTSIFVRNAVSKLFNESDPQIPFWHWFEHSWLIVDPLGRNVRDFAKVIAPTLGPSHYMLLAVNPDPSSGGFSGRGNPDMAGWLMSPWLYAEPPVGFVE